MAGMCEFGRLFPRYFVSCDSGKVDILKGDNAGFITNITLEQAQNIVSDRDLVVSVLYRLNTAAPEVLDQVLQELRINPLEFSNIDPSTNS